HAGFLDYLWRTEGDSNPRYAIHVYTLSRRAPSTARPPVLILAYLCDKIKRSPPFYQNLAILCMRDRYQGAFPCLASHEMQWRQNQLREQHQQQQYCRLRKKIRHDGTYDRL